jgi:endogenous inhibitor of DNA gyrase (YacG/DUF329 family)
MPNCPRCKRPLVEGAFEPPFPFCSQRCKLVDLDGWLSERYVVSEAVPVEEDGNVFPEQDE